jgi:hypothetical protein
MKESESHVSKLLEINETLFKLQELINEDPVFVEYVQEIIEQAIEGNYKETTNVQ